MKLELNKREIKTLRLALFYAMEWESSYINALEFDKPIIKKINGQKTITSWKSYIPKENKEWADESKRNIKNFRKVLEKIKI